MQKNLLKIGLDLIMALLLCLMYRKNLISISFHEIAGLAIGALFLVHKSLNCGWIVQMTQKFFSTTTTGKARLNYTINVLLLLSVSLTLLSGIFISKVLFHFSAPSRFWQIIHPFAAALLLILLGIHLGLNWDFVKNMFHKIFPLPQAIKKPFTVLGLTLILLLGSYGLVTSNFTNLLLSPASNMTQQGQGNGDHRPNRIQNGKGPNSITNANNTSGNAFSPKGSGLAQGNHGQANRSNLLAALATYLSITGVFTVIVYYLRKILTGSTKARH